MTGIKYHKTEKYQAEKIFFCFFPYPLCMRNGKTGIFTKEKHSYPVIFQKADIFAMFEREKIDFSKIDFVRFP
jgi:hypothetical protein